MTVAELMQRLKRHDKNKQVYFSYPYGDACNRVVAASPSDVVEGDVEWSNYLDNMQVLSEDRDQLEDSAEVKGAIVIEG